MGKYDLNPIYRGEFETQKEAKEILQMVWKVAHQIIDINIFGPSICVKWGWDHFYLLLTSFLIFKKIKREITN